MKGIARVLTLIAVGALLSCSKSEQRTPAASEPKISGSPSDPPVSLQVNWQVGGRYVMRMEMRQTSEFRRGTSEEGRGSQQMTLAHEYAIGVTNTPARSGIRTLDVELLSIEMEETAGERTFLSYDSQNRVTGTGGNPVAEQLARLVGGHVRYLIDSDSKVISEEGVNDLIARANPKSNKPNKGGGISAAATRQTVALESLKEMLALTAPPDRLLAVGDDWPSKFQSDNSQGGAVTILVTNIFRGWQEHDRKKCARIDFSGTVVPRRTNSTDQADIRGMRRGMLFNEGVLSGVCWVDPAAAFPIDSIFEQSLTRTGTIGPQKRQGTNAPPQTFTARGRQTVSFKLIDMNVGTGVPVPLNVENGRSNQTNHN